ncbi:hypothetical protein PAXRUDRAFT_535346 [Paxillus rubicundulus Ve08.2h10]|uniref:Uncharacterized protein n=1 Tax=Paxillus rubicundulus Ve08.2h10 TaxID=930991 RepID=A0A0D0D3N8_9AGAM|nr:hypothetical protein PAXRUDRAFT_535346 [Paxillus rubicundulus Ve08.2h10]
MALKTNGWGERMSRWSWKRLGRVGDERVGLETTRWGHKRVSGTKNGWMGS